MSVLGYTTWLETHAPSCPLLRSLSQAVAGPLGPQLLRTKAHPNSIRSEEHDPPWASFAPSYSRMPRTRGQRRPKGFAKTLIEVELWIKQGEKFMCSFNRAKIHMGSPNPAPPKSSTPAREGAFPGPRSAGVRDRGGCCSKDIMFPTGELPEDSRWARR